MTKSRTTEEEESWQRARWSETTEKEKEKKARSKPRTLLNTP
jgi:hypothetical protein